MKDLAYLQKLTKLIRYDILTSTTQAGSGHPTSSLSAVELMAVLFFNFLRYDLENPHNPANDRVIFSKGHASPLLYSLYRAAGAISYEELMTLRTFGSNLEGHPTPRFSYVDVATGSLGQGLSVGMGMALGIRLKSVAIPKVFVLLGDSEMAEGQVWETMQVASYYKLNNLVAIVDVNRLGQRGETMLGWDVKTYAKRADAFGWKTITIQDGNDLKQVNDAFTFLLKPTTYNLKPVMIIAKTVKGKGVSFLENKDGWHGKAVPKERLQEALNELRKVDLNIRGKIQPPQIQISNLKTQNYNLKLKTEKKLHVTSYKLHDLVATREAYGDALAALGEIDPRLVVLDAETSNSTYAEKFGKKYPERFFEMFIAEQNMISAALGLSKQGFIPFASTFAAFLSRAFDQIRMAQYSFVKSEIRNPKLETNSNNKNSKGQNGFEHPNFDIPASNLKIVGSHAGVSIGSDGPSQMALEDLAMLRSILHSIVLYPSDAVSSYRLTTIMAQNKGLFYLRTTREKTPIIYQPDEEFKIGGSKILRQSPKDAAVVFAAGITVHEALKAYEQLKNEQISIAVVDLYSIKPIDQLTVRQFAMKVKNIIIVEDHYPFGGLGEAVKSALFNNETMRPRQTWLKQWNNVIHLAVSKIPHSGSPQELLHYEEIDAKAIISCVRNLL